MFSSEPDKQRDHKYLNRLKFLLKCRSNKVIPKFISVKCSLNLSARVSKSLYNFRLSLLRAVIQDTRKELAFIEKELYLLHLKLSCNFPFFSCLDQKSWERSCNISTQHSANLDKKFSKLVKFSSTCDSSNLPVVNQHAVVNLSNIPLSSKVIDILKRNNNFSIVSQPSLPKLVAPIEKALKFSALTSSQKDSLRHLIINNISFNSKVQSNFNKSDKTCLNALHSNPNIIVTKADKGGQIVIMDKVNYFDKVTRLLQDGPYISLNKDPSNSELNKIKSIVKSSSILSDTLKCSLVPSVANCARFYALPKVHKLDIPLRPIVSNIGTASYKLAKYLVSVFSPLLSSNCFTVKNSVVFAEKIRSLKPANFTMVSFDVKSLFTNVPVSGSLDCLRKRLEEFHFFRFEIDELISLTKACLDQNTFVWQSQFFRMSDGLAMGNPLSPILSDIYMHYFEVKLFNLLKIPFYVRYVDDCFVLLDLSSNNVDVVLSVMNSIDPHIQFTYEMENNNSLAFLDTMVIRSDNTFLTTVYRKPFSVSLPPHRTSCHPPKQKIAAFNTFVYRALKICSNEDLLKNEINYIKAIAVDRGYSPTIVDSCLKRFSNLSSKQRIRTVDFRNAIVLPFYPKVSFQIAKILKKFNFHVLFSPINKLNFSALKDPIETSNSWGIYKISCQCGISYIGQTKRALKFRLKEHENYVKKMEINKSSIASHCWEFDHKFDFGSASIIQHCSSIHDLDFYEAFHIHKNADNLVNDISMAPPFSSVWKSFLHS